MGKGDQRTRKGKIVRGTYGVTRPKKNKKKVTGESEKSSTKSEKKENA